MTTTSFSSPKALDEVRREHWNELRRAGAQDTAKQFKGARWSLLKNPADLTERQADTLAALHAGGKVPRAWALKEMVRAIFAPAWASSPSPSSSTGCSRACRAAD